MGADRSNNEIAPFRGLVLRELAMLEETPYSLGSEVWRLRLMSADTDATGSLSGVAKLRALDCRACGALEDLFGSPFCRSLYRIA